MRAESKEHRILRILGYNFLKELGCKDIKFNELITSNINDKIFTNVDVIGLLDNKLIIIECGGCHSQKLTTLCQLILEEQVEKIYILPYGEEVPFVFFPLQKVCKSCGHKISKNKAIETNKTIQERLKEINTEYGIKVSLDSQVARKLILEFRGLHIRKQIIEHCALHGIGYAVTNKILFELLKDGKIERVSYGLYSIGEDD